MFLIAIVTEENIIFCWLSVAFAQIVHPLNPTCTLLILSQPLPVLLTSKVLRGEGDNCVSCEIKFKTSSHCSCCFHSAIYFVTMHLLRSVCEKV